MAETISALQIVGKTLTAKTTIRLYRDANDTAPSYGSVSSGQSVGVVDSWLDPSPNYGRSGLWWVFKDAYGSYYYTPHKVNYFDVKALESQGVVTADDILKQAAYDSMPWYEQMISKYGWVLIAVPIAVTAVPSLIDNIFKTRKV